LFSPICKRGFKKRLRKSLGYIRGSIKDMQSLLRDVGNNIPLEEGRFGKVEDERVRLRCNIRKVCREI